MIPSVLTESQRKATLKLHETFVMLTSELWKRMPIHPNLTTLLIGPPNCGKASVVRTAADAAGIPCQILDPTRCPDIDNLEGAIYLRDIEARSEDEEDAKQLEAFVRRITHKQMKEGNIILIVGLRGRGIWTKAKTQRDYYYKDPNDDLKGDEHRLEQHAKSGDVWKAIIAQSPLVRQSPLCEQVLHLFPQRVFMTPPTPKELKQMWGRLTQELPKWARRPTEQKVEEILANSPNLHGINLLAIETLKQMQIDGNHMATEGLDPLTDLPIKDEEEESKQNTQTKKAPLPGEPERGA